MQEGLIVVVGLGLLIVPWVALGLAIAASRRSERLEGAVHQLKIEVARLRRGGAGVAAPERAVKEEGETATQAAAPVAVPVPVPGAEAAPATWEEKQAALRRVAMSPPPPPPPEEAAEEIHELDEADVIATEEPAAQVESPAASGGAAEAGGATPPPLPPRPPKTAPKPPGESWEQKLATKLPVWIGAVALALAGIFMVRFFAEHVVLSPLMRVCLAGGFGLGMIGIGELLRRRQANIAQGLAAAGVAVLYGTLLSAVQLHGLISPIVGFVLMALVTAGAVALSLRHGPFVALLGLVGGFLMPALLGARSVPAVQIFGFLLLLQIALAVLSRSRAWWWLTALTMVGGIIWAAAWLALYDGADSKLIGIFLLASAATLIFATLGHEEEMVNDVRVEHLIAFPAVGAALALMAWLISAAGFTLLEWGYMAVLGAGAMVLARMRPRYLPLVWLAAAAGVALLAAWGDAQDGEPAGRFYWIALAYGVLYAGGAYAAMWGSDRPAHWARLSGLAALAYLLVAYFSTGEPSGIAWWAIAGGLSLIYAAAAWPVQMRRGVMVQGDGAMAALTLACCAFAGLAVPMELERQWIGVAWGIEIVLIAAASVWLKLPQLRAAMVVLGGLIGVRLLLNPFVLGYPIGAWIIFNWLLYGYGVPAVCLVAAARLMRRDGVPRIATGLEAGAAALGFAMITLMVRHGFHPAGMDRDGFTLYEWSTYAIVWGVCALGLLWAGERWSRPIAGLCGQIVLGASLAVALLGAGLADNPLIEHTAVGSVPVLNWLLYLYGIPAAIALAAALWLRNRDVQPMATIASLGGLLLTFGLVTLEVRQAFHGAFLDGAPPSSAEWYAYSATWIVFAAVLLAVGVVRQSHTFRWASLAVMLASIVKVFIFDTAHLGDLWRVVSFLGLGVSLLLLAWVYQRFVFSRSSESNAENAESAEAKADVDAGMTPT